MEEVCASCGIAAVDNVTLKKCPCNLVKYCSVDCQVNHRPEHKKACKKRLSELRDVVLFRMPDESHLGECPICCLPLPLDASKSIMMPCCSKHICKGCHYTNMKRQAEAELESKCAFCREPAPKSQEDMDSRNTKRVEANDCSAIAEMGKSRRDAGDYEGAVKYFTKAAELGDVNAHHELAVIYDTGVIYGNRGGGIRKDHKKFMYHLEEACIGGHVMARCDLGGVEQMKGNRERSAKHNIIAAKQGDPPALNVVKMYFTNGDVSKEDYDSTLREHQAALDATKSAQRERAYAYFARVAEHHRRN